VSVFKIASQSFSAFLYF